MKNNVFDLYTIKNRIKKSHENFIKSVGNMPDKISMDHQLLLNRMVARLDSILKCFVESKIIDDYKRINLETFDRYDICFKVVKNGYDRSVYIWTNGHSISVQTSCTYLNGLNNDNNIFIPEIDFDSYDWVEFSDKLLDYIHAVIYARVKSYENIIFKQ